MEMAVPRKIHIIGSVGSGKTTLARTLSLVMSVPHHELDNVVWKRYKTGDIRRSDHERDEYLQSIIQSSDWIIEGVHYEWVQRSFMEADLIIFLNTRKVTRTIRIIKRFIFQKLGLEKANYTSTITMFRKMFDWNNQFENKAKQEILTILSQFEDKLLILNDNKSFEKIYK